MNENELELQCLERFRDIDWDTLHGPDIAPDGPKPKRSDYSKVILAEELKTAFTKINPHLPESCFEQVLTAVTKPESLDVITNNRAFHRMLINDVSVEYKKDDDIVKDHAFLVDFEKVSRNSFCAVNQFTITGGGTSRKTAERRYQGQDENKCR
ncbi:MAG: DEAD/DEAH box helicase, partial [Chitinivibrionales bacterium]|nr:DEAD/DEAH box helicase [Chitinivibrionales bacterium]MBD3359063.1 DEAD/DEAH box helicase [Chitinivibrionales bacterium]